MRLRQRRIWDLGARLWVALLAIFNFGSAPLPCPEYHDVSHHDQPGQSCPFHDHLADHHHPCGIDDAEESVFQFHCHWVPLRQQTAPLSCLNLNSDFESDGPKTDLPHGNPLIGLANSWVVDELRPRFVTYFCSPNDSSTHWLDTPIHTIRWFWPSGFKITGFLATFTSSSIAAETLLSRWIF